MLAPVMRVNNNSTTTASSSRLLIILLAELSSVFVRFFATVRISLSPRLKRARTLGGHKAARASWAHGIIYKGFFRQVVIEFFVSDQFSDEKYIVLLRTANLSPLPPLYRTLTFNILFVICCQTDWLGAGQAREGLCVLTTLQSNSRSTSSKIDHHLDCF